MHLKSIQFTDRPGSPHEWELADFRPGKCTLLVGQNASGKSKTIGAVRSAARLIAGQLRPATLFDLDLTIELCGPTSSDPAVRYELHCRKGRVTGECFRSNGETWLERDASGKGKIRTHRIDAEPLLMDFAASRTDVAVVLRRDSLQYPYIESLHEWASRIRFHQFGTSLGKDNMLGVEDNEALVTDPDDQKQVANLFRKGLAEHGEPYHRTLLDDLRAIDYPAVSVSLAPPTSIDIVLNPKIKLAWLAVQEQGLPGRTDQGAMSQGMFRALSLLIYVNYAVLSKTASCILVDDIGEGLDFDRSVKLIDLLRRKVAGTDIQLIMSTNDRYVMNKVPLDEWAVVVREGNKVRIVDARTHPAQFESFRFTGLNNFDFLRTRYWETEEEEGAR